MIGKWHREEGESRGSSRHSQRKGLSKYRVERGFFREWVVDHVQCVEVDIKFSDVCSCKVAPYMVLLCQACRRNIVTKNKRTAGWLSQYAKAKTNCPCPSLFNFSIQVFV